MQHASPPAAEPPAAQRPLQTPQRLQERGPNDTLVLHSPYGPTRNAAYGWGSLFAAPMAAVVPGHPNIHIGISSLNGVPTIGKSDRSMRSLLAQYRKKFNSLEHCYPYHRVSDAAAWQSWADMVRDSSAVQSAAPPSSSSSSSSSPQHTEATVNAARFMYTVKANNFLTHSKQLQMREVEVQEHVHTYFHQRCPLLEPFLGPVLLQLPPSFVYSAANLQRLAELYAQVEQGEGEREVREVTAASSAQGGGGQAVMHGHRCAHPRLRLAVEFRHRSWYRKETFDLLRACRWALVVAHHHDDPTFSNVEDTGAGFLYVRLHGALGKHTGDYGPLAMKLWAEELVHYLYPPEGAAEPHEAPREVFVYLNNSDSNVGGTTSSTVDATCLAEHLRQMLSSRTTPASPLASPAAPATLATTTTHTTREKETEEVASSPLTSVAVVSAEISIASPIDDDNGSDDAGPPAKRPRMSASSGETRADEVVID